MTTAYRIWEMMERSKTGRHIEEDDFLPKLFTPTLKKLIKKYEIKYDPATPVPADDEMADRIWQAGWDLFREVGYYNTDTHRIIRELTQDGHYLVVVTSKSDSGARAAAKP